jgi:hypothetical protein
MLRANSRNGTVTVPMALALILVACLAAALADVAWAARAKVRGRNAADAAALAAATTFARAITSVTAANHFHGQLAAAVALHEGIGGPDVGRKVVNTTELRVLEFAILYSSLSNPELSFMTSRVLNPVKSGAAIYDARVALRKAALAALKMMSSGKALMASVVGAAYGALLYKMSFVLAGKVAQEWLVVDGVEYAARAAAPAAEAYRALLLSTAGYANRVVRSSGPAAVRAAQDAALAHGWSAEVVPSRPGLPVVRESQSRGSGPAWPPRFGSFSNPTWGLVPRADLRPAAASQWARAAYPWLADWRPLVVEPLRWTATISGLAGGIGRWSDALLVARADQGIRRGLGLHVMPDSSPSTKGAEPWTRQTGSRLADERFGVLVVAHAPAPPRASPRVFGAPPTPVIATAQGMPLNANTKHPGGGGRQPVTGWDTLNWAGPVAEFGAPPAGKPRVRLGWGATLVPAALAPKAATAPHLPPAVRARFQRVPLTAPYSE